jgi:NAD(P)-dependent dehydrogenase (short-subunit alcohol dehydrogenase family)
MDFHRKVALITGAGNGIGRAAALGFASRGAKVVVVDRDQAAGEATVGILRQQGGEAHFVAADVTQSTEVQNYVRLALEKYGAIDCFYNNAGIEGSVAPTHQYDEDMFDRVMAVNVKGVFLGSGSVVNTASVAGLVASPGMSAYVASKHAVIGLTKTAAGEVARSGVRVNCVCPGPIDTRMIHSLESMLSPDDPGSVGSRYQENIPIGRYGTAEEVANLVIFLSSGLASNITGAHYVVDGGRTATGGAVTNNLVR